MERTPARPAAIALAAALAASCGACVPKGDPMTVRTATFAVG